MRSSGDPRITSIKFTFTAFWYRCCWSQAFRLTPVCCEEIELCMLCWVWNVPHDDTIRNSVCRFGMGQVQRLFEPLAEWQMQRLPQRADGYTLDLDSTVFERYGQQRGLAQRTQPRKHGRPSHHPLLAVLSEAHSSSTLASQRQLRTSRGGGFLKELSRCGDSAKRSLATGRFSSSMTSC